MSARHSVSGQRAVTTVLGPIAPEELGVTLSHDHVLIDAYDMSGRYDSIVDDEYLAAEELGVYRDMGGRAVVDPTNIGLGRNPEALRRLSEQTRVHIVMGSGWYRERVYPRYIYEESVNDLADRLVRDLVHGADDTPVRAGFIGEIGTERRAISPAQERVFRAAARAHQRTNAPILTHTTHFGELALEQLDLLAEEGVDPRRVVVSHLGDRIGTSWWLGIAERGAFLSIDNLGFVSGYAPLDVRADNVAGLIAAGHLEQLLLSNDICMTDQLARFGGPGYGNVIQNFLPLLRERAVTDEQIETMLVANPARAFASASPIAHSPMEAA